MPVKAQPNGRKHRQNSLVVARAYVCDRFLEVRGDSGGPKLTVDLTSSNGRNQSSLCENFSGVGCEREADTPDRSTIDFRKLAKGSTTPEFDVQPGFHRLQRKESAASGYSGRP